MNILKLLNKNETAMVTAGQIYSGLDANLVRYYFVPGSDHACSTLSSARRKANTTKLVKSGYEVGCGSIDAAKRRAGERYRELLSTKGKQNLITHFFPLKPISFKERIMRSFLLLITKLCLSD